LCVILILIMTVLLSLIPLNTSKSITTTPAGITTNAKSYSKSSSTQKTTLTPVQLKITPNPMPHPITCQEINYVGSSKDNICKPIYEPTT
ncbi:MAG TPA: hypothetical protein VMR76_03180, partial [Candidatus Saccharimonadia bacterium]|nr:hypothetical protein [Candidatus Saccharimonadia bacterium]